MNTEKLYQQLQKINEAKGYYFNRDMDKTMFLLESLVKNRERYGYMCCPCRLAQEDAKADRDIICPCAYREADVREFGACYCQLYVSKQWNEGPIPEVYVPERRPEEPSSRITRLSSDRWLYLFKNILLFLPAHSSNYHENLIFFAQFIIVTITIQSAD